jgi:U3 small nucleolar RNA-associated protein 6
MQYATLHVDANNSKLLGERVRKMAANYLATARVWAKIFALLVENSAEHKTFQEVYEMWREKDSIEATIAWGRWLLMDGRGKEATAVVVRARSCLKESEKVELEKRWAVTLDEERVED